MSQPRFFVEQDGPPRHWAVIDRRTGFTAVHGTAPTLDWRAAVNVFFSEDLAKERALELNLRFDGWALNR